MSRSRKDARGGHFPGPGVGYTIRIDGNAFRHDWREISSQYGKRFWKRFKHRLIRNEQHHIIHEQLENDE